LGKSSFGEESESDSESDDDEFGYTATFEQGRHHPQSSSGEELESDLSCINSSHDREYVANVQLCPIRRPCSPERSVTSTEDIDAMKSNLRIHSSINWRIRATRVLWMRLQL